MSDPDGTRNLMLVSERYKNAWLGMSNRYWKQRDEIARLKFWKRILFVAVICEAIAIGFLLIQP